MSFEFARTTLTWCGVAVLILGIATGTWVWKSQAAMERDAQLEQAADPSAPLPPADSRKQVRDLEIYYGKLGPLIEKTDGLLHGKSLAKTIIAGSLILSGGLFLVARRRPASSSTAPSHGVEDPCVEKDPVLCFGSPRRVTIGKETMA